MAAGLVRDAAMQCAQAGSQTSSCRPAVLCLSYAVLRCAMRTINRAALLCSARKARSRWPVSGQARPGIVAKQLSLVVKLSDPDLGSSLDLDHDRGRLT